MELDQLQKEIKELYQGSVIEIGGRPYYVMCEANFLTALELAHTAGQAMGQREAALILSHKLTTFGGVQ